MTPPNSTDATKIESFIKGLSEEELLCPNRLVFERLKLAAQGRSTQVMSRFNLGEEVRFPDHDRRPKAGRVVRLNKRTATILTSDGQQWNVAPGLLNATEDRR